MILELGRGKVKRSFEATLFILWLKKKEANDFIQYAKSKGVYTYLKVLTIND